MMASSPHFLLTRRLKQVPLFWHRRLSNLNFGSSQSYARQDLYEVSLSSSFRKDHLCSASALGNEFKETPQKPKSYDTKSRKTLFVAYWILCGANVWSRDEAPAFIINFLKMIQVRLKETVRRIKTDNGTEFVNQTLREYYEKVGISHETSVARSPQQNGVVERRNQLRRHGKNTILAILHGKPSRSILNLKFFCALCYPTNDSENLVKLQTKAEFEFIHWIRTHEESNPEFTILLPDEIIETIHVDFDELTAMASEHSSSGPALHEMTPVSI
ncbi:retrovirus-related pol polyprotein from transposon TNT 1-94 [Tanacetum coccineum]|uniref:Retrovirus-related pol polyprotein from transposon TNT 1-94 n=1 Tax=Tanacetum coccineum TaxID=301880 RepID=A0ABQ5DIR8_9ASTR